MDWYDRCKTPLRKLLPRPWGARKLLKGLFMKTILFTLITVSLIACDRMPATKTQLNNALEQKVTYCPTGVASMRVENYPIYYSSSYTYWYTGKKLLSLESSELTGEQMIPVVNQYVQELKNKKDYSVEAVFANGQDNTATGAKDILKIELKINSGLQLRQLAQIACGPQNGGVAFDMTDVEKREDSRTFYETHYYTCYLPCK